MSEIKFRGLGHDNMVYPKHNLTSGDILNRFTTVMQYTGLKDKNGVDIYENDIVRGIVKDVHDIFDEKNFTLLDEVGIVKMKEGIWMLSNEKDEYAEGMLYRYDSIEVIGNIYANPSLL